MRTALLRLPRRSLRIARRLVLGVLLLAMFATAANAVHFPPGKTAVVTLVLLAAGALCLGWSLIHRCIPSVVLTQSCMVIYIAAGIAGLSPTVQGPIFQGGTFLQMGLLGLLFADDSFSA